VVCRVGEGHIGAGAGGVEEQVQDLLPQRCTDVAAQIPSAEPIAQGIGPGEERGEQIGVELVRRKDVPLSTSVDGGGSQAGLQDDL